MPIKSNIPSVKLGLVATSRDCFPASLAQGRREAVEKARRKGYFT